MPSDLTNSKLLTSELCFTLLRLFSAIAGIVVTLIFKAEYYYDLYSIDGSSRPVHISNGFHVFCSGILAVSSVVILNDIFILTADYQRTSTFLGLLLTQAIFSLLISILTAIVMGRVAYISYDFLVTYNSIDALSNYTPIILSGVFSLCLLAVDLLALWSIRSDLPLRKVWSINAKDAMVGRIPASGSPRLTWNGHARSPPRSKVYGAVLSAPARRFFMRLLFRRVSPAETRPYAFVRNVFAIFSIAAIIWRAVTAFSQAQNGFETRMVFRRCPDTRYATSLHILIQAPLEAGWADSNITVSASAARPGALEDLCTFVDGPKTFDDALKKIFTIFDCPLNPRALMGATRFNIRVQYESTPSIRSKVWLSNNMDSFKRSPPRELESLALRFTPAGRLEPGFHLDADAGFVTRRFVDSSLFNDVILQRQTIYKELSVYPLTTTGITPLNDSRIATASISMSFLEKQAIFRGLQGYDEPGFCDYIDEYRSTTVFDVIGSVGGLFALLQSLHVLLFGRPMLWGLTGAKLITPFGLLGSCSTAGFKRRLREGYHRQDLAADRHPEDVAETIRIGAFLRDFVIDFGPADIPPVPSLTVTEPDSPRPGVLPASEQSETLLLSTLQTDRLSPEGDSLQVERNTSTSVDLNREV